MFLIRFTVPLASVMALKNKIKFASTNNTLAINQTNQIHCKHFIQWYKTQRESWPCISNSGTSCVDTAYVPALYKYRTLTESVLVQSGVKRLFSICLNLFEISQQWNNTKSIRQRLSHRVGHLLFLFFKRPKTSRAMSLFLWNYLGHGLISRIGPSLVTCGVIGPAFTWYWVKYGAKMLLFIVTNVII